MNIREAFEEDARAIAEVNVLSWKTTYKGIVSDNFLSNLSVDAREEACKNTFRTKKRNKFFFAAENSDGKVVGYITGGVNREIERYPEYAGELYAIYLLESYQGQGLGQALVRRLMASLSDNGIKNMMVCVLAENRAKYFYEKQGAVYITKKELEIDGEMIEEHLYGWQNLSDKDA